MNNIIQPIVTHICGPVVGAITERVAAWNPHVLFSAGQKGAWWDNQDLTTMFQDSAGTTPVTAAGQSIGKQLDKSGNGNHRTQATSANRPVLAQRSDGIYYIDYAGGKSLSVPSSTALFNYLHDGTGGTLAAFIEWPSGASASAYLRTASIVSHTGFNTTKFTTDQSIIVEVNKGGSQAVTGRWYDSFVSSAARMIFFAYKNDGAADDLTVYEDSSVTPVRTAVTASAPSASNASLSLQVATTFGGREYEVVICNRKLTGSEARLLWSYMHWHDYPVPASVDITLLLGGQSNMSGRGTLTGVAAEQIAVGVYSYTKADEFRIASVPEHTMRNRPVIVPVGEAEGSAQHGFALRLGKALYADSGVSVLLVPCASGSTSIEQWDTPSTRGDRTTLFGSMVYQYGVAAGRGGTPIIVWSGHENSSSLAVADYTAGGVGTAYQSAWQSLVADVRAELGIPDAPLIFCQLASDDTLATAIGLAAAGEAQRQCEASIDNACMVVTHDVQRNASPDDIHVSRAGFDVIADRVALAIRQHVLGESVNGTGPRIVGATYSGAVVSLACDKAINASAGNFGNLFSVYNNGVEATVSSAVRNADTSVIDITCSATLTGPVTLTYGYRAGAASAARTDFVMDADSMPLPLFGPIAVPAA